MIQVFNIFLVLAIFHAVISKGDRQCCGSKTVGLFKYTLIGNEADLDQFGCKLPCVYEKNGEPGSKFCFKSGDLPVTCAYYIPNTIQSLFSTIELSILVTDVNGQVQTFPLPPLTTVTFQTN